MKYLIKKRCPVCSGSGSVEPSFQSPIVVGGCYTAGVSSKMCPACEGTGMQEVEMVE